MRYHFNEPQDNHNKRLSSDNGCHEGKNEGLNMQKGEMIFINTT